MDTADSRFDPNLALHLLLEIAHEHSLEQLLEKLMQHAVERPYMSCVQIWLIEPGDRCAHCRRRPECPDQTRCLHLVAGKGVSLAPAPVAAPRFNDPQARHPLEIGFLGGVVRDGEQRILRDLTGQMQDLTEFDWLEAEKIRACGGTPILYKGEKLGVIMGFSRATLPEEGRLWGRVFADHIGAAIANARAFQEIRRLQAQLEQQNAYLEEEVVEARAFGDLIGQSAALRQILSQIELVASTEASVLILGETGTGKELVAREIHRRSPRRSGPLVRVNCASIPKDLFESEFFGHIRGSFTGAIKDRAGRFETAEGGTLFLDEIGEIPLDMQAKLLRVLQEKRYERLGDDRTRQADVRIVAASNRDLPQAIAAGRFREDLFYRLHVFPIHVTPLRQRRDDIPLLAQHFVQLSARELRCPKPRLTRAALLQLQGYDWPGNVRELRNVIERAVILARGGALRFDLPSPAPPPAAPRSPARPPDGSGTGFLTETQMRERERANLQAALEQARWKIKGPAGAAALLGIKPTTLLSRMKKQGLRRPPPGAPILPGSPPPATDPASLPLTACPAEPPTARSGSPPALR